MRPILLSLALVSTMILTVSAADTRPSEQHNGTIEGKVLHQGKPIGGIRVAVMAPQEGRRKGKNKDADQKGADEKAAGVEKIFGKDRPKPAAQTVTDSEGRFSVDVPAGTYVVIAAGKKIGMAHERVDLKAGETKKIELNLEDRPEGRKGNRGEKSPTTKPID